MLCRASNERVVGPARMQAGAKWYCARPCMACAACRHAACDGHRLTCVEVPCASTSASLKASLHTRAHARTCSRAGLEAKLPHVQAWCVRVSGGGMCVRCVAAVACNAGGPSRGPDHPGGGFNSISEGHLSAPHRRARHTCAYITHVCAYAHQARRTGSSTCPCWVGRSSPTPEPLPSPPPRPLPAPVVGCLPVGDCVCARLQG